MARHALEPGETGLRTYMITTMLASTWGLVSAYVLFAGIVSGISPNQMMLTVPATLVPLICVWATIERKRWGRIALFGLSATAIGLCLAAIGLVIAFQANGRSLEAIAGYLPHFVDPSVFAALFLVAIFNACWLRRPVVVAEFERNKRSGLAIAQRVIATSLVGCWGMTMILTPYLSDPHLVRPSVQHGASKPHQRVIAHRRSPHGK